MAIDPVVPVVAPVVPAIVTPPVVEPPAAPLTLAEVQAKLTAAEKANRDLNHENAERRVKLTAYEKAEADRATAALSETEKLTKRATDAEAARTQAMALANERLIRSEVIAKAATLKFADPKDALALIDRSKLAVNDAGEVTGVDDLLKALAAAKPYMLGKPAQMPLHTGNPGTAGAQDAAAAEKATHDMVYGTNGNPFDASYARAHGGGVIAKE